MRECAYELSLVLVAYSIRASHSAEHVYGALARGLHPVLCRCLRREAVHGPGNEAVLAVRRVHDETLPAVAETHCGPNRESAPTAQFPFRPLGAGHNTTGRPLLERTSPIG